MSNRRAKLAAGATVLGLGADRYQRQRRGRHSRHLRPRLASRRNLSPRTNFREEEPMPPKASVLVVANRTADSAELIAAIRSPPSETLCTATSSKR